jgi:hypothetical protein
MLSVIVLSDVMLTVVMLSVVLSVREPNSLVSLDELLRPLLLDLQLVEEFPFPLPDQINRLPAFRDFLVFLENPSG